MRLFSLEFQVNVQFFSSKIFLEGRDATGASQNIDSRGPRNPIAWRFSISRESTMEHRFSMLLKVLNTFSQQTENNMPTGVTHSATLRSN